MKTLLKTPETYLAAYVIVGFICFGHCWSKSKWDLPQEEDKRFMASFGAGALWPAYVSIKLWE